MKSVGDGELSLGLAVPSLDDALVFPERNVVDSLNNPMLYSLREFS